MTTLPDDDEPDEQSEDARLFREAVRGVRPLRAHPAPPRKPKVGARAQFTRADRAAVLRRLRRGDYRVQREIDLHGMTVAEAKLALREFLVSALEQHVRCVRIVHGKGLRSGHRGPVLKAAVSSVLRRTGAVLAYVSARPVDGGTGAVYVLLSGA